MYLTEPDVTAILFYVAIYMIRVHFIERESDL